MTTIDPKLRTALTGISGILVTPFDERGRGRAGAAAADHRPGRRRRRPHPGRERQHRRVLRPDHGGSGDDGASRRPSSSAGACRCSPGSGAASATPARSPGPRARPAPRRSWCTSRRTPLSPRAGSSAYVERVAEAGDGLPLMLYLRNDGIGLDTIERLCRVPGVAGVKWASPTPLRLAEAIRRGRPGHRLGRRPGRDLGAAALRGRRARVHVRPDQRLAGALGGHPRRARGGRLSARRSSSPSCPASRRSAPRSRTAPTSPR